MFISAVKSAMAQTTNDRPQSFGGAWKNFEMDSDMSHFSESPRQLIQRRSLKASFKWNLGDIWKRTSMIGDNSEKVLMINN